MKESIANSYVFSIVIIIVGICTSLIVISMNYSKVFKMKNRVIEIIEKHGKYDDATVGAEIETFLESAGYPPYQASTLSCPTGRGNSSAVGGILNDKNTGIKAINKLNNYKYCIYQYKTAKGSYYSVVLYMIFDFPIIGDFIKIELPMYGDTKIIFDY